MIFYFIFKYMCEKFDVMKALSISLCISALFIFLYLGEFFVFALACAN